MPLRPSRWLAAFTVISHGLAGAAVWFSALPWWVSLSLDLLVLFSLLKALRRQWSVGVRRLRYDGQTWTLAEAGSEQCLELAGERLVTPWLIVLGFLTQAGKRISLVLPPDSASRDDLRRLRVALRLG